MDQKAIKQKLLHKQLLIEEVIDKLTYFSQLYGVESLFVVGGYCRAMYMGNMADVKDIDVASAYHEQAVQLGSLFSSEVANQTPTFYKRSGTAAVQYKSELGEINIEFQGHSTNSYMHNQEVKNWMHQNNIEDIPLMNNIYGRDFTINSMIFSLSTKKLYDPTGRATKDFDRKILRTLLPSDLIVKYNPLIILRAIRFALRYDFHIDASLRSSMKLNTDKLIQTVSEKRIMKEIVSILKINANDGLEMLKKYELDRILLHPEIKTYVTLGNYDE